MFFFTEMTTFMLFQTFQWKKEGPTPTFLSHGMYSQIILYESLSPRMMRRVITIRLKIREL